jgi:hypothetical protein
MAGPPLWARSRRRSGNAPVTDTRLARWSTT